MTVMKTLSGQADLTNCIDHQKIHTKKQTCWSISVLISVSGAVTHSHGFKPIFVNWFIWADCYMSMATTILKKMENSICYTCKNTGVGFSEAQKGVGCPTL